MAIVTISRGTLSGGCKLAEMLAERLNYKCISREVIIKAMETYDIPAEKLFEAILKSPTFVQRLTFERERYLAIIQAVLCEYVKNDNIVYHGHAGHLLLPGISHVIRIRVLSAFEYRIKQAQQRENFSRSEAIKYIKELDKQRVKWTKFLYNVNWRSPWLYDVVINLEHHTGFDFACNMIEAAVHHKDFTATPESQTAMKNLLLSSKIKAVLAANPDIRLGEFDIKADGDIITIVGKSKSEESIKNVIETVSGVPGVKEVKSNVKINYRYQNIDI